MDYDSIAASLGVKPAAIKAIAEVESSGVAFWTIAGEPRPPVRLEAHWFGKLTHYQYSDSHPHICCRAWSPTLAARTRDAAWAQLEEARCLDNDAAIQATSWGPFQLMGFHWQRLGYASPAEMAAAIHTESGQVDAFSRFIKSDVRLLDALRRLDWEAFAGIYNGPGQVDHYAGRIAQAYARHGGE